jgi:pimeloyl-ACP methyl ester carboxylesterase
MMNKKILVFSTALLLILSLALTSCAPGAPQVEPEAGIWELYPKVIAEYIKIPGYQEPHTPAVFNNIYFMRYRYDTGKAKPPAVKAVIIGQPGLHSGQSVWYELAAQTVDAGKGDIEFWVIDRRENCFEDTLGLKLALDAKDAQLGLDYYYGTTSEFVELEQEDMPFMAYWGLEVAIRDVEAVLNLIPEERQATNVFLAGHSQGGSFLLDFAGYQFADGKAGFQKIAGLIFIDGGPMIIDDNEDTLAEWQAEVQKLIDGEANRWGATFATLVIGPSLVVNGHLTGMLGFWDPDGESQFRVESLPAGGLEAMHFLGKLRLTNEALHNFRFDDDPIPGSMTQMETFYLMGMRCGRLDFPPLTEPGVPVDLPDTDKVYGWLSGGAGEVAGETNDGPLSGYPYNQDFVEVWQLYPPNPNVTRSNTACLHSFFAGEATNIKEPTKYEFPVSGEIEIYEGSPNNSLWYSNNRYTLDVNRATDMSAPEMNITRKADIAIPTIAYQSPAWFSILYGYTWTPMEEFATKTRVSDWTVIGPDGVQYSAEAQKLTTFPATTNTRLYNHMDFTTADNSLAGEVPPGSVGANVVSNTLIPWVQARAEGSTPVPTPEELGIE